MKVLVTGGTGLVGNAIAKKLVEQGHEVRALVRDIRRASLHLPGVELLRGDITEPASLTEAVRDVGWVFHAAGMPEQWQRDEGIFDRVNRQGTRNVLEAALAAGVRRVIYTSTMDVFAAPPGGTLVEDRLDHEAKHTAYERSKQAAEREAEEVRKKGLDVVHVNPAGVYGRGPSHVGMNSFFIRFLCGKIPLLPPGGLSLVYADGCADAHIAAAQRGRSGERYLISDGFSTNADLAREIARYAGVARVPPTAPAWLAKLIANVSAPFARALDVEPLVAPSVVTFMLWQARVDSSRAIRELGFSPRPIADGVRETVDFLRAEKLVPA